MAAPQQPSDAPEQHIDITAAEWLVIIVTGFTGVFGGPLAIVPGAVLLGMFAYRVNPELMRNSKAGVWVRGLLPAPAPDAPSSNPTATRASVIGPTTAPASAQVVAAHTAGEPARVYLSEIATALNVAIIGPKGSGKTTTMSALLRMRLGYVEALDPHNEPGKWPCAVVGGGEHFEQIHTHLLAGYATMRARYVTANTGERTQATYQQAAWRVTFAGDEWGGIVSELPDIRGTKDRPPIIGAGALLGKLIARGRKVGIGMLIAAHDDTAAQFGLASEMGLVDCFDWLVYLGGQATGNTTIPSEVRAAARRMTRPAVALDTERHTWHLLMLDSVQHQRPHHPAAPIPSDYGAALPRHTPLDDTLLENLLAGVQNGSRAAHAIGTNTPDTDAVRDGMRYVQHTNAPPETPPGENAHTSTRTPGNAPVTADELRRLIETARLIGTGTSMTTALCKAFATTKGSKNPRYQRARALWQQYGEHIEATNTSESVASTDDEEPPEEFENI